MSDDAWREYMVAARLAREEAGSVVGHLTCAECRREGQQIRLSRVQRSSWGRVLVHRVPWAHLQADADSLARANREGYRLATSIQLTEPLLIDHDWPMEDDPVYICRHHGARPIDLVAIRRRLDMNRKPLIHV